VKTEGTYFYTFFRKMGHQAEQKLNVPIIDISSLVSPTSQPDELRKTVAEIGKACEEWGFFYIVGHGIDPSFIQRVQALSRDFFERPKEFKKTVGRTSSNFRGYTDSELTKQTVDWKEAFDFGAEIEKIEERTFEIEGDNRWPQGMPEFRSNMIAYFDAMHSVSEKLMSAIFTALKENPERFVKDFDGSRDTSLVRLNYYPICPNPKAHLGVGPHSDAGALTILWQDQDVSSLQVEKEGVFYDVYPVPNSFVINIGDMAQVWSNGLYKAPVHRVLANHHKERFSAPFFYTPSYSCNIQPLDTCVSKTNPAKYRSINWGDFRKGRFAGDYADVGEEIQIKHFEIK